MAWCRSTAKPHLVQRGAAFLALGVLIGIVLLPVRAATPRLAPTRSTVEAVHAAGTPAVALCGVANPGGSAPGAFETPAVYTGPTPPLSVERVFRGSVRGLYFDAASGLVYVETSGAIVVTTLAGRVVRTLRLPERAGAVPLSFGNATPELVVDPSGAVYVLMMGWGAWYELVKLSPDGSEAWAARLAGVPNGVFAWHGAGGRWAAAVVARAGASSALVSSDGSDLVGTVPVSGDGDGELVSPTPAGGLTVTNGQYVDEIGATGTASPESRTSVPTFGATSAASQVPGAPFAFASLGGAVQVGSTVYVADDGDPSYGHGLDVFTSTGIYEGDVAAAALGGLAPRTALFYDPASSLLVFQGDGGVGAVKLAAVQALLGSGAPPTDDGFGDVLGIGAGLVTPVAAGYFPAGQRPFVGASFAPWWGDYPDPLVLRYWAADESQLAGGGTPKTRSVVILAGGRLRPRPSLIVPGAPGAYLVDASLIDTRTGRTIGATCLTYSVGAPGQRLDFARLSAGISSGGPAPERGVELAAALGTGDMREQLSLAELLPNCRPTAPTASACGPAALSNWDIYEPAVEQASLAAKRLGVRFEIQVGEDLPVDEALVSAGYWATDARAIIFRLASSAPDLRYVEAWNEPNTGPYRPSSYVSEILRPVWAAVQSFNAETGRHLEVIGGSVLGMDVAGWWTGIADSGGFSDMNIVGIHPYPGYDRSFEEEGSAAAIRQLEALLARHGAGAMPIWDTEQGWWSDGEEAFFTVGDWAPREWMWLKALHVRTWNYFISEGQFDGYGSDFALIDAADTDDFVKPGALGLMTVAHVLSGKPFLKMVPLPIPDAYGMLFGSPRGGGSDVLAVWTDDLDVPAELSTPRSPLSIRVTGVFGAAHQLSLVPGKRYRFELSGAPTYFTLPAGRSVTVSAAEAFGRDLALAGQGAEASASSVSSPENAASDVIQGTANAQNGGSLASTPAWASTSGQPTPWIEVTWPKGQTVDRVIVSTSSVASILPGLRSYTVLLESGGQWKPVTEMRNEYFNRNELLSFRPVGDVTGVKVVVHALDDGGLVGGLRPFFWSTQATPAVVYSVAAYAPGDKA